ncbi:hypothetical protein [Chromobacterium vaccinii]|uniref:hypothetical protein n=1 Tax=Chromobacterium vaccinii TaxID=1108595 RepID=UPI001E5FC13D|nr:hypothetical protein [Chromobacterium vaccinii]MCD4501287.1 hypothetical protein [Chromobacterium vaccinii]
MSSHTEHEISPDVVQAALENPNGWVYKIEGEYGPAEYVPPEVIVGAWKVDENGNLTGEFMPNPKYQPGFSKTEKGRRLG